MIPYGAIKRETVSCRYGCCGGPLRGLGHKVKASVAAGKCAKNRARRNAKIQIQKDLSE